MSRFNMDLFKQLFCGRAKEAWSHKNLEPAYNGHIPTYSRWGVRRNYRLYDMIMKARTTIGPAEIQHKQFMQMVIFKSKPKNTTITPITP